MTLDSTVPYVRKAPATEWLAETTHGYQHQHTHSAAPRSGTTKVSMGKRAVVGIAGDRAVLHNRNGHESVAGCRSHETTNVLMVTKRLACSVCHRTFVV